MFLFRIKRPLLAVSVCAVILTVLIVTGVIYAQASRKGDIKEEVMTVLIGEGITYRQLDVRDYTLTIAFDSSGADRCTFDDVKAIQAVYDAVHTNELVGTIKEIDIKVYSENGTLLFDQHEAGIDSRTDGQDVQDKYVFDRKDDDVSACAYATVNTAVALSPFTLEDFSEISAKDRDGNKIILNLTGEAQCDAGLSEIQAICDSVVVYAQSAGTISQCEISVMNKNHDCIAFLACDCQYGNRIAWVSADAEANYLSQMGPKPVE